jgi:tetratricopeptide (TPR) repeat protein
LSRHFTREAFTLLFGGPPERAAMAARAIRHVARCPRCWAAAVESVGTLGASPFPASDLRSALVEIVRGTVREETDALKARAWWADLRQRSPARQLKRIRSVASLQTLPVFEVILAEARKTGRSDPYLGEATARVALAMVDLLPEHPCFKSDLRAEAMSVVANCRRIAADWRGTAQALEEAWRHLAQGTGDPGLEGNLLSIESSYRAEVGEIEQALSLVRRAVEIFHRLEDGHGEAHNVVLEAGCLMTAARPAEGLEKAKLALERMPPHEIRLQTLARLIVVDCLITLGKPPEALHQFDLGKPVFDQAPDLGTRLQIAYCEARLLDALDRDQDAERLFRDTVKACFEHELYKEGFVALVTLFGSLCRRGALRKAADLCEEAITAVAQSGEACNEEVRRTWEELLAVVKIRQPTDEELDRARNYLLYNWGVPKGGSFSLPRLAAAVARTQAEATSPPPPPPVPAANDGLDRFQTAREAYDRILCTAALEQTGGNISEASRLLGITPPTLRTRMREYGL